MLWGWAGEALVPTPRACRRCLCSPGDQQREGAPELLMKCADVRGRPRSDWPPGLVSDSGGPCGCRMCANTTAHRVRAPWHFPYSWGLAADRPWRGHAGTRCCALRHVCTYMLVHVVCVLSPLHQCV